MKREIPGMQTFSTSAVRQASKSSPRSSGKSASSEPGGPWNKDSVSCLQAISRGTKSMTAELAMTSKIPHRGEAPLASRCNEVHPAQNHNKHRSERARVLDGSTCGEASEQTQSHDILKSKNKMKDLFNKTNIDSEHPSGAETQDNLLGGTTTVPHPPTFDILSGDSEEEETDDDLLASWQDTRRVSDLITFPRTVFPSSSASSSFCHSAQSLQFFSSQLRTWSISGGAPVRRDRCSLTSLLEKIRQTHGACRDFEAYTHQTQQHLPGLPSCRRTSQSSSPRMSFCQRESALVNWGEDAVHTGTSTANMQSSFEARGPSVSEQLDYLNVDMMTFGDIEELIHGGAARNTQKDSKGMLCRPKPRLLMELSNEEEDDQCRICHSGNSSPADPLVSPCLCSGSLQFIHLSCLKKWIKTKIQSGSVLYVVTRCELCLGSLTLDPDTFDLNDYCRRHRKKQQVHMAELYNLREAAEVLTPSSLLLRTLLPELVRPSCPAPRVQIWPKLYYLKGMRLRRIRARMTHSPTEACDS